MPCGNGSSRNTLPANSESVHEHQESDMPAYPLNINGQRLMATADPDHFVARCLRDHLGMTRTSTDAGSARAAPAPSTSMGWPRAPACRRSRASVLISARCGLTKWSARAASVFRWRPFHLLVILQEMKHVPFADKPTKSAYMWRDIERRAAMCGGLGGGDRRRQEPRHFRLADVCGRRELFWGDDRLEDAISWHRHGSVRP